jgi:hypothetical protein
MIRVTGHIWHPFDVDGLKHLFDIRFITAALLVHSPPEPAAHQTSAAQALHGLLMTVDQKSARTAGEFSG